MGQKIIKLNSSIKNEILTIDVGEISIQLKDHPNVWLPHDPTLQFLATLEKQSIKNVFKNANVLDIGTGTGVLGIWALKAGAKKSALIDVNKSALKVSKSNMELNGYDSSTSKFKIFESDVFSNINETFDIILANPPVQPELPAAHVNEPACKYNENSCNGRYVLDEIIKRSKDFLKPNGKLFLLNSTRQGFNKTIAMMDEHWGSDKWEIIFEKEYDIDTGYHGPYMNYWLNLQKKDGDLRVYYYETKTGKRINSSNYKMNLDWKHRTILLKSERI